MKHFILLTCCTIMLMGCNKPKPDPKPEPEYYTYPQLEDQCAAQPELAWCHNAI